MSGWTLYITLFFSIFVLLATRWLCHEHNRRKLSLGFAILYGRIHTRVNKCRRKSPPTAHRQHSHQVVRVCSALVNIREPFWWRSIQWKDESLVQGSHVDAHPSRVVRIDYVVPFSIQPPTRKDGQVIPWRAVYGPWTRNRQFPPHPLADYQQEPQGLAANEILEQVRLRSDDGKLELDCAIPACANLAACRGPLHTHPEEIDWSNAHHWPAELLMLELFDSSHYKDAKEPPTVSVQSELDVYRWKCL